jgi:hypothetical protein
LFVAIVMVLLTVAALTINQHRAPEAAAAGAAVSVRDDASREPHLIYPPATANAVPLDTTRSKRCNGGASVDAESVSTCN